MKVILLVFTMMFMFACDRNDQAGATGSGAGIEREEDVGGRQDASQNEDMNITTPIEERTDSED